MPRRKRRSPPVRPRSSALARRPLLRRLGARPVDQYVKGDRDIVVRTTLDMALQRKVEAEVAGDPGRAGRQGQGQPGRGSGDEPRWRGARHGRRPRLCRPASSTARCRGCASPARRSRRSSIWPHSRPAGSPATPSPTRRSLPATISPRLQRQIRRHHHAAARLRQVEQRRRRAPDRTDRAGPCGRGGAPARHHRTLHDDASLALGTSETSLLSMTAAYATFANAGNGVFAYRLHRRRRPQGNVVYRREGEGTGERRAAPISRRDGRHDAGGGQRRHRQARRRSTVPRPARPAPPRIIATPGSSASPPTMWRACGSATTTIHADASKSPAARCRPNSGAR